MKGCGPIESSKKGGSCINNEELKTENERLKQENLRLQQVLQEVTAVNKRWQRYNTDRRIYVQKLLGTIQELQEQMNDRGESAMQWPASSQAPPATETISNAAPVAAHDIERLRRQHDEETRLLRLQIKSHKSDWDAEHREKMAILQEKDALMEEFRKIKEEADVLRNRTTSSPSSRDSQTDALGASTSNTQATHIASQHFTPRSSFQTSFQVPFIPDDDVSHLNAYERSGVVYDIRNSSSEELANVSWTTESHDSLIEKKSGSRIFLSYPSDVNSFPRNSNIRSNQEDGIENKIRLTEEQHINDDTLICPNCFKTFSQSLRPCFLNHFDVCKSNVKSENESPSRKST